MTDRKEADRLAAVIASEIKRIAETDDRSELGHQLLFKTRRAAARLFADAFGWRRGRRPMTVRVLARRAHHDGRDYGEQWLDMLPHEYGDHSYYYRSSDGRAAAIAAHLYDPPELESAVRFGEDRGLTVCFPDWPSWHYPGRTTLILWRPAS